MSSEISLLNIPDVALTKILEKCDLVSVLVLRKVCHHFRNFIDSTKPEQFLTGIDLWGKPNCIRLILHLENETRCYPNQKNLCLTFEKDNMGCKVIWWQSDTDQRQHFIDGSVSEVFEKNFHLILKLRMPILNTFEMSGVFDAEILEKISQCLKCNPVRVKNILICGETPAQIKDLLPGFTAVEKINISGGEIPDGEPHELPEINGIVLDQTMDAKEFHCRGFFVSEPIQSFAHFDNVRFRFYKLTADALKFLKNLFLNSTSKSKCFYLFFQLDNNDMLIESLGEPSQVNTQEESMTWFFRKNSETVLKIYGNRFRIAFENKGLEDVPEGARIMD